MGIWNNFRRWCRNKNNAPLRRLLGLAVVGTIYLISGNLWATFVGFVLWLILTK